MNQSHGFFPKRRAGFATKVVRCRTCGLIYTNPQPIPERIADHYGLPPENYWKEEYFKADPGYFSAQIATYASLASVGPRGTKALDIGAGIGKCMRALEAAGYDAFGIEASEPFYRMALDLMGIEPARLSLGGVEDVILDAGSFDFITFGAVLEHLYEPAAALQRALSWLKPDGLIHVEVPSSAWLVQRLANLYYKLTGQDYVANLSPMHAPFHLYEFTPECFRRHGQHHGYGLVRHRHYVCQSYVPRFIDPLFRWYMDRTETGMQLEVWLRRNSS